MRPVVKRMRSVSSSKVTSILNKGHFGNVVNQWLLDTKQKKPTFTSKSRQKMDMGTKMEPVIKAMVEEYFKVNITVDKQHYMHEDYDFYRVEFDGLDYENEIIYEFKNTEQPEDALLEQYYAQVQFAMFIRDWNIARLCYLRNGWDLGYIEIERDDNFIKFMKQATIYYWECVQSRTEPDPKVIDEIVGNIEFYKQFEMKGKSETPDLEVKDIELLHKWGKIKRQINELQIEESGLKGHFADKWGKYKDEYINYNNAEYKRKGGFDIEALMKDYPDIDFALYKKPASKYTRQTLKYKTPPEEEEVTINREEDIV